MKIDGKNREVALSGMEGRRRSDTDRLLKTILRLENDVKALKIKEASLIVSSNSEFREKQMINYAIEKL